MSDAVDRAAVQSAVRAYLALEDADAALEVERIIAALPAVSAPVAVRVKDLQWLEITDDDCDHEAYAIGLRYWIETDADHYVLHCGTFKVAYFPTLEAAKAAAQADYEARITPAIDVIDVAELTDPVAVHANMLRGTIATPTVEQIIHLYGADALRAALTEGTPE